LESPIITQKPVCLLKQYNESLLYLKWIEMLALHGGVRSGQLRFDVYRTAVFWGK